MQKIISAFLLSLISTVSLLATDNFVFSYSKEGKINAILVLIPGMNVDGFFFLKESPWMDFAKKKSARSNCT